MWAFDNILIGVHEASTWQNLFYCFLGVTLGNLLGVLPGLGAVAAVSILLPVTYHIPPATGLIMLAGLYYGAVYGAVTGAILLNIPHTVSAVECLDGYPMAQNGRAGVALFMTTIASLSGSFVGNMVLAVFAIQLSSVALLFGSPDYFSLVVLGLTASAVLAKSSPLKSLVAAGIGMLLGLVGLDQTAGLARFTFDSTPLLSGINVGVIAMGLFGVSEIIANANGNRDETSSVTTLTWKSMLPTSDDLRRSCKAIARGAILGSGLGLLPGAGPVMASIMGYAVEKQVSGEPERFGRGAIEGVVAPEAAANAACQTAFVPTLTLGIPTDPIMAIMLAALTVKGIAPGPEFISSHPEIFWGLVVSFVLGNIMLVIWHIPFIGIWVRLLSIPFYILYPIVLVFMCIGVYTIQESTLDIMLMFGFGCLGYVMRGLGFPPAPLLIGLVLGPQMETYLRRSLILSHGSLSTFVEHPISRTVLIAALALIIWTSWKSESVRALRKGMVLKRRN